MSTFAFPVPHPVDRATGEEGNHYRRAGWIMWPLIAVVGLIGISGLFGSLGMEGWRARVAMFVASLLMTVLAIALFRWNRVRGVWTNAEGVRNVGAGRPSFTRWAEIDHFSIDRRGSAFAVYLERTDGSREALQNEINLSFRRARTERFAAVMNAELAAHQSH